MRSDSGFRGDQSSAEAIELLIQASLDSGQGFQETAADVAEPSLARLFRRWSIERFEQAERLRKAQGRPNIERTAGPSWLDGWRRVWLSVRGALNAHDRATVLRELERAEGIVCQAVELTLLETANSQASKVLEKQLAQLRDNIRTLHALRFAESAPKGDGRKLDSAAVAVGVGVALSA
jgi:uncharacterized protein (TIGR02284 family)